MKKYNLIFFAGLIVISFVGKVFSEEVNSQYCYTYGDNENLIEAKITAKQLALRSAIENHQVFIESTSKLQNFTLTNDIVYALSTGFLENCKESYDKCENTVCCAVTCFLNPSDIKNFINKSIEFDKQKKLFDKNECIKILNVRKSNETTIDVVLKIISVNNFNIDENRRVSVTYHDINGDIIGGSSKLVNQFTEIGDIISLKFNTTPDVIYGEASLNH